MKLAAKHIKTLVTKMINLDYFVTFLWKNWNDLLDKRHWEGNKP